MSGIELADYICKVLKTCLVHSNCTVKKLVSYYHYNSELNFKYIPKIQQLRVTDMGIFNLATATLIKCQFRTLI